MISMFLADLKFHVFNKFSNIVLVLVAQFTVLKDNTLQLLDTANSDNSIIYHSNFNTYEALFAR
jgi:hypothetical protein